MKKIIKKVKIALIVFIILFLDTKISHADLFGIGDIAAEVLGKIAFGITWLISMIASFFIAFEAFIIEVVLQLNNQVIQTDFVKTGFNISLAVANLFFVAGIIVMAIATILRIESYSMKNMLSKLILMAILVNFGLTIGGTLIEISNNFAFYFLKAINPSETGYGNFTAAIVGSFDVQKFKIVKSSNELGADQKALEKDVAGIIGAGIGGLVAPIVAIFLTIVILVFIIITLGALAVMFLIRYIVLSILLALLPIAWVGYVFPHPKLKEMYSTWWSKFTNWLIFAPVTLFLIYLCLITLKESGGANNYTLNGTEFVFSPDSSYNAMARFSAGLIKGLLTPILRAVIFGSCFLASIIVGQKLGVEGSQQVLGKAETMTRGYGKAIGVWAPRGMASGARALGRAIKEPIQRKITKPEGWLDRTRSNLQKISTESIGGGIRTRLKGLAAGYAGRGLEKIQRRGRENVLEQTAKRIEKMSIDELINNLGILSKPERLLALERIEKEGKLHKISNLESLLDENLFESYNKRYLLDKIKNESGLIFKDILTAKISQEIDNAYQKIVENMQNRTSPDLWARFFTEFPPINVGGGPQKEENLNKIRNTIVNAMFKDGAATPDEVNTMFSKLKRGGLREFVSAYNAAGINEQNMNPEILEHIQTSAGAANLGIHKALGIKRKEGGQSGGQSGGQENLVTSATNLSDDVIARAKAEGERRRRQQGLI